jgi:membrane dipeptidase
MTNDPFSFDRRLFLGMAGASALLPAVAASQPSGKGTPIIVNALGGLSDPNDSEEEENRESRRSLSDRVIADARASGLTAVNITMGFVAGEEEPFEQTVREIARWEARVRSRPDDLIKVLNVADIVRARRLDRIGIIYGFQNAAMMATDIDRVDVFADLGVRVFQLTYNRANHIGGGSMSPEGTGISPFGRQVIERLNARKVMVDLSHSGERTCLEAARISQAPVSINHTGCRALTDLPRNKTDEELRLVAERGGFVGIYFMPFLSPDSLATAEDVVAHIDHAVNVCGEDHVGIGTDGGTTAVDDMDAFRAKMREEVAERRAAGIGAAGENPDTLPFVEELSGPDQFRRLIALLEQRGYTSERIEKIMGLNFISFAGEIWG